MTIPTIYRIFFLYLDPLIAASGVYMAFFTPSKFIDGFLPPSIAPYSPLQQSFLLHQLGGALLLCIILDLFLLRKTNEVWIWKVQQAGQLVYDVAMLAGVYQALQLQGRLNLSGLRAEDWGTVAITGVCGVVRALFCAGVGLRKKGKGRRLQ